MSGPTGAGMLMSSSALTPAEEAYFTSRGEDTSAFAAPSNESAPAAGTPAPEPSSSSAPAGTPAAPAIPGADPAAPAAPAAAAVPGPEPTDDELIDQTEADAIGDDGKPRSGGEFVRRKNFRVVSDKMKTFRSERDAFKTNLDTANQELTRLRDERARLDERLRLFNEALTPPAGQTAPATTEPTAPPPSAPPPDPNVDPLGTLAWLVNQQIKAASDIGKAQQTAQEAQNTLSDADAYQRTTAAFVSDAQRFAGAGNADFMDAYHHGLNARAQMYLHSGITDRTEIQRRVKEDERIVVENALKAGKSPAEAMYNLAKALGYQKAAPAIPAPAGADPAVPAAQAVPAVPAAPAPAAATPPAPAPAAPAPNAADEVARVAAAQAASRTLSNAGGGTPVMQMTIDRLLKMTDSEFSAYERQNPGVVATLMGKE